MHDYRECGKHVEMVCLVMSVQNVWRWFAWKVMLFFVTKKKSRGKESESPVLN